MIRISIVTITFNAERTLQRTLDSVRRQNSKTIEHLIIDGASTDNTVAMAQRYAERVDYDVRITSEPDKGLYDAMNKGLRQATGDYVLFLNAGDTLHDEETLSVVARAAEQQPRPAVVYGDTAVTDAQGVFLHMRQHRPPEHLSWRSFRWGMLVCHQAFYARTDIARGLPYDITFRHSADVDWCIRVMKEAERQHLPLVNTHAVLADFETGGDSTQNHRDSLKERFLVMTRHYGWMQTMLLHGWFVIRAMGRRMIG